ncbi:MAG: tyrosine-type recombinase/integrase [Nocardioides sp.]|nr:tyrosine-type recombinase/integrase [Nocardioides sp.]
MTATKTLGEYSADYLRLRRTMGHKLARHDCLLASFLAEQAAAGRDAITLDAAIAWARAPRGVTPGWWAQRLSAVRGLADYVHNREPGRAEQIPVDAIPARTTRTVPYIYTQDQIRALMAAAATLQPPVRGLTVTAIIGLMAATGLRISECMALNVTDVDGATHVLAVTGKRGRSRLVPIHPSTTAALSDYRQAATALIDKPDGKALFLTWTGTRAHAGNIEVAFRGLIDDLGYAPHPGGRPPRLHDLRHSFSTDTLTRAHQDGADVDATVAVLATYLGHVSPASTYWYLTATPQLLELTATKVAAAQQEGRLL